MGEWVKALEAKARIILGQLAEARKLAEEAGLDPEDVAQPYLDLINDLYRDEWQFAQLADEDRTLTFSQREGYDPLPKPLQLGELPDEARTAIWNVLSEHMERSSHDHAIAEIEQNELGLDVLELAYERRLPDPSDVIRHDVHVYHNNRALDELSTKRVDAWMRDRIERGPFNRVFDLIEFILQHDHCPPDFVTGLSDVFRRFQLAYVIDPGPPPTIFPATTAEEGNELRRNLADLGTSGLIGGATHLRNASKCINDGDSAGSVRESIHAVESVARQIDPKASQTLGPALVSLDKRSTLHPTLKVAFNNLYGYTNREQGVRHALLDKAQANVTIDEAVFMLGACASFASYLWRKHKAATAR